MKHTTKKITLGLFLLFVSVTGLANGLENIIVEKYYVSNASDTSVNSSGGVLPVGSVTYRIYVDMLPGYKFQAAYGVPDHELRIVTSTLFFNNEDRGTTSPTFSKTQASRNTVMLDSWLSVGAACTGNFGILKTEDDGVSTVVNTDGVLQNNDAAAGIPLTVQDGFIAGTPEPVTTVGITTEIAVFDAQNDGTNGPVFSTWNGSWASLYGSTGPDSIDNKVLIAQITTDGTFSFELNIQIGTPGGGVENYVAQNPIGSEIQFAPLIYSSITDVHEAKKMTPTIIQVFPCPTADYFTLEIRTTEMNRTNAYTLYDLTGKVLMHREIEMYSEKYAEKIDMSSWEDGIYFIEVISGNTVSVEKIIKN